MSPKTRLSSLAPQTAERRPASLYLLHMNLTHTVGFMVIQTARSLSLRVDILTRACADTSGSHKPVILGSTPRPATTRRISLIGKAAALKAAGYGLGGSSPSSAAIFTEAA